MKRIFKIKTDRQTDRQTTTSVYSGERIISSYLNINFYEQENLAI